MTHVVGSNRHGGREQEDDRDKGRPHASPGVDEGAGLAEVPGAALELAEAELADDGDAVRPVEADGADVEDGRDGRVAAQADQVDQDAEQGVEPDGQDGRVRLLPDLVPYPGAGQPIGWR